MNERIFNSEEHKKLLLSTLRVMGVNNIVITFSGGGDNGNIDSATAIDKNGTEVDLRTHSIMWPDKWSASLYDEETQSYKYETVSEDDIMTVGSIVEHLCELALEQCGLDWYNDNGGQGEFVIDMSKEPPSIKLTVGINEIQVTESYYTF